MLGEAPKSMHNWTPTSLESPGKLGLVVGTVSFKPRGSQLWLWYWSAFWLSKEYQSLGFIGYFEERLPGWFWCTVALSTSGLVCGWNRNKKISSVGHLPGLTPELLPHSIHTPVPLACRLLVFFLQGKWLGACERLNQATLSLFSLHYAWTLWDRLRGSLQGLQSTCALHLRWKMVSGIWDVNLELKTPEVPRILCLQWWGRTSRQVQ